MPHRNLWLLNDAGEKWEIERLATTADVLDWLIAEGGEMLEVDRARVWAGKEIWPGRWLLYGPIPVEGAEAKETPDSRDTGEKHG